MLPTVQYVSTLKFAQGEEREFFVNKIKEIAVAVENAPKINATDGLEEHRIVLRYFHPSGTQSFITEIGKDGDAFGFQCLNDDWYNAEWGYINLDELKNIRGMEVDFHVPAGMTVERFLYKEAPEQFPKYAKFTNKENAPAQNKKSPFDVAMETGNDIEAIAAQLKTYHTLKEEDVKDLEIISDEDFSDIVDSIILNDYRHIPNIIRLPNLNAELCEKLGLAKDSAFIMKKSTTHIRPNRKGNYEQAFDTEEYRLIPQVIREANFVLVDKRTQNFQVVFDDKDNISKINKIVFNKDELGNYIVTIGKVDRRDGISEKDNTVVGVGVAPTISALRFPEEQPATRLRPSPTTVNQNIPQTVEKSSLEELSSANETRITWDDILQAAEGSHWNDAANAVYNNARNQIAEYAKNLGVDIENSESPEEVIGTFAAAHEEISFSKDGSLVIDEFLKPIYFNNLTDEQKEEVINGYRSADDQQMLEEDNYYKEKEKIPKSSQKKIREQCREILKKPDSEITEADKKILAQYEGGGGLNENNRTNSEVLNAFYTPDNLIEKVWELVDAYAPDAKTVLEPSAGVGKFANNRPDNKFTMYELNETSARINKILHPEADVIQGAFQKQFLDDGERFLKIGYEQPKHDVVIGNPPYGKYNDKYKGLGEGREFDRYEEYFIARGLEALKDEKSVLAFVVPSGFLNTVSDKQKSIIASKGEILDAYRLPEGTFSTTEVGTDILIMRKKESLDDRKNISGELLSDGEWFKNHPEKILGEIKTRTNRFGKEEEYVAVHEGLSVQDELNKIDSFVDEIKKANQTEKLKDPLPEYSSDEENTEIISSPEIFTDEFAENITKFKKSLNNYFEKGIRPENDRFVIGKTPLVLQKTGSDVTEVTVPVSVIKKALETHGLSQDEIFSSLAKMYNPVLVFDSDKNATENKVNSKLILTDVFKDENPVALAVNVNSDVKLKDSNISVEVQDIRSVHDRNVVAKNGTDLIQKWANNGLC